MTTTSTLLPRQSPPEPDPDPVQIPLRRADFLFDALSSETAREILSILGEEPKPTSEVAAIVGTSTRHAAYHIDELHDAGLLSVVDTWYSVKGREMDIHATRYEPFVLTMDRSGDATIQLASMQTL